MKKTITCNKCNGRGYFTYEQNCTDLCGVVVCRCEVCRGKGMIEVPVTNADRIRSMTDEELAEFLDQHGADTICDLLCGGGCNAIPTLTETAEERCRRIILAKLQEPYKEKEHGQTIGDDAET